MCGHEPYIIDLLGLAQGHSLLSYELDGEFFEGSGQTDIMGGKVAAELDVERSGDIFLVKSTLSGWVTVMCDLCLDPMEQPIASATTFSVRLGDDDDYDGDVIIVARDRGEIDMQWLLTEQTALAIPIKHVHAPGKCNAAMTERLNELSAARSSDGGRTIYNE